MAYLWAKSLHIVFVASWFAGLFYLPRLFVNLAMETEPAAVNRLLLMARKLYRFMTIIAVPALVLGFYLMFGIGIGKGAGWMHAKLAVVVLILVYHHLCGRLLRQFEAGQNRHGHRWYRIFNEIPVLGLLSAVCLVVFKPF
ncbi:membrane protein [Robbsia andropogonis]|uniref:Protoporphyrinogen IX oxidase n=1 Tax=Robbsia andropogonis TaxID=28092 RepID=A0A0F5JZ04_9BURK|nr:CopD family protein [Robbsia andropogonis]KKB63043.1 membrane protein [Robbsia andropogonis]MCP1118345.1 CopD family protein [Robbsia andropogonis]MCP1127876.1 CopD family protein [Robbsia andropogonis]